MEDREDHRRREHAAEHEHVAVREVDQLEDPVDERVAERDERVDGAVREPDERDGEEVGRRPCTKLTASQRTSKPTSSAADHRHHVRSRRAPRSQRSVDVGVAGHWPAWRPMNTGGGDASPGVDSRVRCAYADQARRGHERLDRDEVLARLLVDRDRRQVRVARRVDREVAEDAVRDREAEDGLRRRRPAGRRPRRLPAA